MASKLRDHVVTSLILDRFLPYQLNNIAKRISDACSTIYTEKFGLSIAQWRVLAKLGEVEQLMARDIGQQTLLDKSRVSRVVKQLEKRGLVRKTQAQNDQRVFFLALSAKGRTLYQSIVPDALDWEASLLKALDLPEYRDLLRIVEKLDRRLHTIIDQP
jgi:DNA-binding MarR family transcriptional regulator